MRKATFPERSAHLSYVAPLIGLVVVQQLGARPAAFALVVVLLAGGLFSAFTGLRWSKKERGEISLPAVLGLAANVAFLAFVVVWAQGAEAQRTSAASHGAARMTTSPSDAAVAASTTK